MLTIKCLASGSAGNSYAVDDDASVLLLEAGIRAKRMMSGYAALLPRVSGCLITHEHQDHAAAASEITKRGIDLYATAGTLEALGPMECPYRCHTVHAGEQFRAPGWTVLPWEAKHDAAEPVGYLLQSDATGEKLLFATDTYYIPHRFCGLNVIMVECNYSLPALRRAIAAGRTADVQRARLMQSHFSLENVRDFFLANDLSAVSHIYLLHLSRANADPREMLQEIKSLTGKPVTIL